MYLEYWGFKEFPFENVPDPKFFYLSRNHEEALTRLIYAAKMRKGGAMLSGEVGCGKTTLTKVCIEELSGERFDIGLIVNPKLEPIEFLQEVLYQFRIHEIPETKVMCLRRFHDKMIENVKANRETLLMVDEAQLLSHPTLEEIRLLLNYQSNDRFLLTVILLGQPELKDLIRGVEQLEQRIAIQYHLAPFDFEETGNYMVFRQKKAGRSESAFSEAAVEKVYGHAQGVPRKINNICDLSLLVGFSRNEKLISPEVVESIIHDGAVF